MMKKIAITLMVFVFTISATSQESVLLRYNYKKGDKYEMKMVLNQNMGMLGGVKISMNSDVNVINTVNNTFELATQTKKVHMNSSLGGQEINFDSDTKEEDLDVEGKKMKADFDAVMKATTFHSFTDSGKIISMRTEPTSPGIPNNKDVIGYSVFPKEAVKVGSTWTQELSPEGMKLNLTYKVKEITKTNVIVDVTGTLGVMGIQGNLTGSATFNRATGNTDNMKLNSVIEAQGMTMTMSAEVSIEKI